MLSSELERLVSEDLGPMDDSSSIVPEINAKAVILAREKCVVSGLEEADDILKYFRLNGDRLVPEGTEIAAGSRVLEIRGQARGILQAERTDSEWEVMCDGDVDAFKQAVAEQEGTIVDERSPSLDDVFVVRVKHGRKVAANTQ